MNKIRRLHQRFIESSGISTDTRKILPNTIFFALKGEKFDGNTYAEKALAEGAILAVVDDEKFAKDKRYLLVDSVLKTLQDLANYHRIYLGIPIIGLTGSNGKTTTKELIREVLATAYNVVATTGNLNNHIGVPLTLLSMNKNTEIGVVEMGANHIGEIARLCEIAQPTHGLITNIGKAHLEGFGSLEGVLRAKSELYNHLILNNGVVFINSDDEILMNMRKRIQSPILYNNAGDFYQCELISADPFIVFNTEENEQVHTHLIGAYNFKNIAAALCIAKYLKIDGSRANAAIANYLPENNRSQIIETSKNKIILDAYNANPISMAAALDNLAMMKHPRKVVILGDMFELGDETDNEHAKVREQVASLKLSQAFLCGKASAKAAKGHTSIQSFATKKELSDYLQQNPIVNSLILIKASRGMGLETLITFI